MFWFTDKSHTEEEKCKDFLLEQLVIRKMIHSSFKLHGEWNTFIANDNFQMKNIA